jgi:nucleotide-binding universal stress UspA family protein
MAGAAGRVVVGVSESIATLSALRVAADQARAGHAPLLAVHAWGPVGGEFNYARMPDRQMLEVWRQAAHDRLRTAFEECFGGAPAAVVVQPLVLRAKPGLALVTVAEYPTDLLVIGTGQRKLSGRFHPGVTGYCLRHAVSPVLCVPPPELLTHLHDHHRRPRPEVTALRFTHHHPR